MALHLSRTETVAAARQCLLTQHGVTSERKGWERSKGREALSVEFILCMLLTEVHRRSCSLKMWVLTAIHFDKEPGLWVWGRGSPMCSVSSAQGALVRFQASDKRWLQLALNAHHQLFVPEWGYWGGGVPLPVQQSAGRPEPVLPHVLSCQTMSRMWTAYSVEH